MAGLLDSDAGDEGGDVEFNWSRRGGFGSGREEGESWISVEFLVDDHDFLNFNGLRDGSALDDGELDFLVIGSERSESGTLPREDLGVEDSLWHRKNGEYLRLVRECSIGVEIKHGEIHGVLGDHSHANLLLLLLHLLLSGIGVDVLAHLSVLDLLNRGWCGGGLLLSGGILGKGVEEAGE